MDIVENDQNLVGFKGENESENESEESTDEGSESSETFENVEVNSRKENLEIKKTRKLSNRLVDSNDDSESEVRRSAREKKKPERFGENSLSSNCIYVNVVSADSPLTYEEALKSKDKELWKEAEKKRIRFEMGVYE